MLFSGMEQRRTYICAAMSDFVLAGLCIVYASMMVYFWIGLLRSRGKLPGTSPLPSVSVVVPLHNEEEFALRTLEALEQQDYAGDWEVICVNDRSTDATSRILEEFCATRPHFRVLHVPMDSPPLPSPKKRALATGFAVAQHEILMTMDADCIPPKQWVSRMAARFRDGVAIVQGPKANTGSLALVHAYQKLETLGLTLIEAAGFSMGTPAVASAACLAYRKDLFFKVGGFNDLMHLTSGDDDMLVHKMAKEPGVRFCYNLDPEATVLTAPVDTWKGLLNQRARWASNGTSYENHAYTFFLTLIYSFFCWLLLSPWLIWFWDLCSIYFWGPFAVKICVDVLFLATGAWRMRSLPLLWCLPLVEFIQIPTIVAAVPLGLLRVFKWK